jgi:hypothetical protein
MGALHHDDDVGGGASAPMIHKQPSAPHLLPIPSIADIKTGSGAASHNEVEEESEYKSPKFYLFRGPMIRC